MNGAVLRMKKELTVRKVRLPKVKGYRGGKFTGDAEDICIRMLMGERPAGYGYYTGLWDIRLPDGSELYESIPEAKGMRECGII